MCGVTTDESQKDPTHNVQEPQHTHTLSDENILNTDHCGFTPYIYIYMYIRFHIFHKKTLTPKNDNSRRTISSY